MIPVQLLNLIRRFEGLRLNAYLCPAGKPTIGYGSTGPDVQLGMTWTIDQAEERLQRDAAACVTLTTLYCPGIANDDAKLAAVADFTYNLGGARLAGSTFRKRINACEWTGAADELQKWVRGGGRVLPGLVARRKAECDLILGVQ
jgi:lysozyme